MEDFSPWLELDRYVLLCTKKGGYVVFDLVLKVAVLIEDDKTAEEAAAKMLAAGARVLERVPV
ncbi:hypothetical protein K8640_41960 [Myxococcus sp. XM-1-1-1]|uniref:hypothetical protein n=1 Tax=Myxococcus sp. XM-1-1-1 TaxID=2874602 RepID=UPI001CBFE4CE|nr:hypothetical protein [Myxococcus sp. XM-1-1-1]MBZ4414799.1 hypothetical protein [Myxococcus sp. XM-1-1-1]